MHGRPTNALLVHALQTALDTAPGATCWWQRDGDGVRLTRYLLGYVLVFQRYEESGWGISSWKSETSAEETLRVLRSSCCCFVLDDLVRPSTAVA